MFYFVASLIAGMLERLPKELRFYIFSYLLTLEGEIDPWDHCSRASITPGVLLTNKASLEETSGLLYARNCFNFTFSRSQQIEAFFECIGENVRKIESIHLNVKVCSEMPSVALEADTEKILNTIQRCTSLKNVLISVPDLRSWGMDELLSVVMKRFKDNPYINLDVVEPAVAARSIISAPEGSEQSYLGFIFEEDMQCIMP